MLVKDSMKTQVITIRNTDDLGAAARQFVKHHVGVLPVVDADGKLVGVLQLRDLLTLVMPAFTQLMEDFDFVSSFGAAKSIQPSAEDIAKKVSEVMEPPFCVDESCGLIRAFAQLHHHNLTDLPVVDENQNLVGIASRVDVGTAILKHWDIVFGA
ncbi:MAG: CBS domain-containing protein [Anaerolineales bacterium]